MAKYTELPASYKTNYKDWFTKETIIKKFNGDVEKACKTHPVYFAYYMLGIKMRDYQIYLLDQMLEHRYTQAILGRRSGKSTTYRVFGAWALAFNKFPQGITKTTKILVIAHTNDEAEAYIEDINSFYEMGDQRVYKLFKGTLGSKYFTKRYPTKMDKAKNNQKELSIYNNGWNTIKAYPPTPKARGKSASIVFCDEIAFWEDYTTDDRKIYGEVVRPIPTDSPNTKIFITSTPNGNTGLSYELMDIDNHITIFKLIWFPYYIRDDLQYLKDIEEVQKEYTSQGKYEQFRQEYLAELTSKTKSYFDKVDEVDKVFDFDGLPITSYNGECEAGLDFGGKVNSRTVFTISKQDKKTGKIIRLFHKRYEVAKDSTLQSDLLLYSQRFPNIKKWHIDNQGGGSSFYGWFENTFGKDKIDEVSFRTEKTDMYRLFKIACYQDRIKSYYDSDLQVEFLNFTRDLKPTKGATDDMLDSFVMSCKDWLTIKRKTSVKVIKY